MKLWKRKWILLIVIIAVPLLAAPHYLRNSSDDRIHVGMTADEFCSIVNEKGTVMPRLDGWSRFMEVRENSTNFFPGRTFSLEIDTETNRVKTLSIERPTMGQVFRHWVIMIRIHLGF
jgi:hypothetical protein